MIIVLKRGTDAEQVAEIVAEAQRRGLRCRPLLAADKPVLHVLDGDTRRARKLLKLERVQALVPTSGPRVRRIGRRFFPYHFLNWSAAALVLLATIVLLAGQFPPGLGPAPDVQAPAAPPGLPWYAAWPARWFDGLPGWTAPLAFAGVFALLFAVPTIDRRLFRARESG